MKKSEVTGIATLTTTNADWTNEEPSSDEPTSALDADSRDAFISLLKEECTASGAALLFVSHDGGLADQFDRALDLQTINTASVKETV